MAKQKTEVSTRRMTPADEERFAMRKGTSKTQQAVHLGRARVREFAQKPNVPAEKTAFVRKGAAKIEFR